MGTNGSPSLDELDERSRLLRDTVKKVNLRHMAPIIYQHLLPAPNIMRDRFRNLFSTTRIQSDYNMQVNQLVVTEYLATQGEIVEGYRGTWEGVVSTEPMGAPLPENRPCLQTYLQD